MEALQSERSPLLGRLLPLPLRPLTFGSAKLFMGAARPVEQVVRYAIAGGMPRYLHLLAGGDPLDAVATHVADPYGPLFNEVPTVLQTELREPAVYFSILSQLARGPQATPAIGGPLRLASNETGRYLATLESLQLVARRLPVGARRDSRRTQWRCTDHFIRFWLRFIHPHQAELEAGADPRQLVQHTVSPALAEHVAPLFEELLQQWARRAYAGRATEVGAWWGPALHSSRAAKTRLNEELDLVVLDGRTVIAAGEARWTNKPLDAAVLTIRVGWGGANPAFRTVFTTTFVPDATSEQMRWFNELSVQTASAENAVRLETAFYDHDFTDLARAVRVPAMVLHARGDRGAPFSEGRLLASLIPDAEFVPLDSANHILLEGEPAWSTFLRHVDKFTADA